jgi:hypothetical protein
MSRRRVESDHREHTRPWTSSGCGRGASARRTPVP